MKIVDFFYYYFVRWITKMREKKQVRMEIIPFQAASGIAFSLLFYSMSIERIINFIVFDTNKSYIPGIVFISIPLVVGGLLDYIYMNRGRYLKIQERSDPKFGVSDKAGRMIAMFTFIFAPIFMVLSAIILYSLST
jgi:hypothetical protein